MMKLIDKEQPTTYEKVGARVNQVMKAKKEMPKFVFICMEIVKAEDEWD